MEKMMERCRLCGEKFPSLMPLSFCDDCGVLMNKEFHTRNADIERRDERKDIDLLIVSVRKRMMRKWGTLKVQKGSKKIAPASKKWCNSTA